MTQAHTQPKLAVLIDADNTAPSIAEGLLAEVAKYGTSSVKRIYGDWTKPHLKGWKEILLEHAIQPIQQFSYTVGKNATDSAMIIDAMDLLHTHKLDGLCIVSSDSDFTRLASRAREAGLLVIGFGERKTPQPFVGACDKFVYTEILRTPDAASKEEPPAATRKKSAVSLKRDAKLVTLLRNAVEDSADDSGWAYLGNIGQYIVNTTPAFDPRNYGYSKLGDLISAVDLFETDERTVPNAPGRSIYVRDRRKKPKSN